MADETQAIQYVSKRDAQVVREKKTVVVERELERLYDRDGSITQRVIVDEARNRKSPLHKYFEWDDKVAGDRYRLQQATQMILATRFMVVLKAQDNQPPEVVAARPVRKLLPALGNGFKPRETVLSEEDSRRAIIEKKRAALKAWCRSVIDIEELEPIRTTLEGLLNQSK